MVEMKYLLNDSTKNSLIDDINEKSIILFLDYDGTLAPFTGDPENAPPLEGIMDLIRELNTMDKVYINLISGRTLESLNKYINLSDINYIGTHGLEIKTTNEKTKDMIREKQLLSENEMNLLDKVRNYFKRLDRENKALRCEDKKYSITLHHSSSFEKQEILGYLNRLLKDTNLEVLQGRNIIEVRPENWNKGKAAIYIENYIKEKTSNSDKAGNIKRKYSDNDNTNEKEKYLTIYIGDDSTDEDAFSALSGINIYVQNEGELDSKADYYLKNPEDVKQFLIYLKNNL